MLSSKHKEQRVAVFVDIQNMYYSAKNLYSSKVDFGKVLATAVSGRKLVRAFAYVIKADVGAENEFFEALSKIGYEVREKDLQIFFGGAKKGDWDVGICMDVIRMIPKIDAMSKDMGMTEAAFRVYHWLCGKANHHCIVRASQGEMAEDIGISRSAVNKAVKYMSSAGYLVQIATLGYELNSNIVRRGVDK